MPYLIHTENSLGVSSSKSKTAHNIEIHPEFHSFVLLNPSVLRRYRIDEAGALCLKTNVRRQYALVDVREVVELPPDVLAVISIDKSACTYASSLNKGMVLDHPFKVFCVDADHNVIHSFYLHDGNTAIPAIEHTLKTWAFDGLEVVSVEI